MSEQTIRGIGYAGAQFDFPLQALETKRQMILVNNPGVQIYQTCAIVDCHAEAKPLNAVTAPLDVFGSPVVQVYLCDEHYRMLGNTTEEMPDILMDEE